MHSVQGGEIRCTKKLPCMAVHNNTTIVQDFTVNVQFAQYEVVSCLINTTQYTERQ
ncbi:hypothetical protein K443DRAFT_214072 [Laccaria amethystina LaAM-08-1]|uniref:Uncharacterized protein n=1 Tax=Laccaria amethystina LaAM-08-1 TaxID=1095629 RepID=A0A0C9XQC3_9AGAR|nr:hypothetical protein K443DRAFT_214072 [Laccaria amethystina LaAM-08-1]